MSSAPERPPPRPAAGGSARRPPRASSRVLPGLLAELMGANPFRRSPPAGVLLGKALRYAVASAELLLVLGVPPYRRHLRRQVVRPVDLMVIGAQKAGTTWLHAELVRRGLAATPPLKESHHFDRGGLWTLRRYLAQFADLPHGLPVIEVAPDCGPLRSWRIRAVRALFPDLRIAFIARNPVDRAWSGARMETAFDRDWPLERVPVADLVAHLGLRRSRRYGDYAAQIRAWRTVFGAGRLHLWPYEMIAEAPQVLLAEILALAGGPRELPCKGAAERVFAGEEGPMPRAVGAALARDYGRRIGDFAAILGPDASSPRWEPVLARWRKRVASLPLPPEAGRRALVICGFAPSPRAMSSGQKLAHRRLIELAARYREVRLLHFVNNLDALDPQETHWPANVTLLPPLRLTRGLRLSAALRYPLEPCFVSARRLAARRFLRAQFRDPALTDFHADFSQGLAAVDPERQPLFDLRQHDVVSRLYERRAARLSGIRAWPWRLEAARTRRWERRAWSNAMEITTLSQEDASHLHRQAARAIRAEPVGGTLRADPARRSTGTIVPGRLGFWGNMAREENADAACHLAQHLLPRIRERVPEAHLWILGAHPCERVLALESEETHVTGYLDDPGAAFATLALAVAPLRLGSGVKIKVLETLEAGVPTVVTPVGGEGLPDHPLLLRATTSEGLVADVVAALGPQHR